MNSGMLQLCFRLIVLEEDSPALEPTLLCVIYPAERICSVIMPSQNEPREQERDQKGRKIPAVYLSEGYIQSILQTKAL